MFLLTTTLSAQDPRGSVRGVVQDATHARVVSATIEATSATSSLVRRVSSDSRGEFQLEGLAPGLYRLNVAAKGFASATANVSISVSIVRDVTVTLNPSSVRQVVGVRAQA